MATILVVEDDAAIREMLHAFLASKSYTVVISESAQEAQEKLALASLDLVLMDWMLPDREGIEVVRHIRKQEAICDLPVMMLTAKAEELDKVRGLDVGADDYMTKPVSLQELDARIRSLLRRSQGLNEEGALKFGEIELNPLTHQFQISGENVAIAKTEFRLLLYLMRHKGRVYSRSQLLDGVWGRHAVLDERTVDVHVLRLRKLLKPYGVDQLVETVRGVGYRFSTIE